MELLLRSRILLLGRGGSRLGKGREGRVWVWVSVRSSRISLLESTCV